MSTVTPLHGIIDLAEARSLLEQAVETQGREFVYNHTCLLSCLYVPREHAVENWGFAKDDTFEWGVPGVSCIVGTALDIRGETWHHGSEFAVMAIDEIHKQNPGVFTDEAAAYLKLAQAAQDTGSTWGEAYDRAEQYAAAVDALAEGK